MTDETAAPSRLATHLPRARTLWMASRPAKLLLVVGVYGLGVVIAVANGAALEDRRVLVGLVALVPTAAGIHYANEYADAETDALTDRTPFSGGSGDLQATGVRRRLVLTAATVALAVGVGAAALLTLQGRLPRTAGWILAGGAVFGVQYSLAPLAFARRGLGEFVNAALGGIALPCYGAAVLGRLDPTVVLALLPFAWFVLANAFETQWPDRHADADVGKDTLAVRWRPRRLRAAYALAVVAGFASLLVLTEGVLTAAPTVFPWPVTYATLPAMPLFAWGTVRFTRRETPYPAVVGTVLVAALQTVAWGAVAFG